MNEKTIKQQVEGKEMLIGACEIEMHQNRNVVVEEEKLIVKKNAMKS
jgi:hypothetical protein